MSSHRCEKPGLSLGPRLIRRRPSHYSNSNPSHSMMEDQFNESEMFKRWFKLDGIMAWVTVTGAILVGLSIVVTGIIESKVVDQAGAHNRRSSISPRLRIFGQHDRPERRNPRSYGVARTY